MNKLRRSVTVLPDAYATLIRRVVQQIESLQQVN